MSLLPTPFPTCYCSIVRTLCLAPGLVYVIDWIAPVFFFLLFGCPVDWLKGDGHPSDDCELRADG